MNIKVNGRHLDVTPAIRSYSEDKIKKFEKYLPDIAEVIVTLSVEKYRHKAEVLIRVNGNMIQAESVTEEIYASIDEVIDKLEIQVKKHKDKITSRRREARQNTAAVPSEPVSEPSEVFIKRTMMEMKPMSPEEAAMQLELLDKQFYVFTNDKTSDINVIYRTASGDLNLIEPVK